MEFSAFSVLKYLAISTATGAAALTPFLSSINSYSSKSGTTSKPTNKRKVVDPKKLIPEEKELSLESQGNNHRIHLDREESQSHSEKKETQVGVTYPEKLIQQVSRELQNPLPFREWQKYYGLQRGKLMMQFTDDWISSLVNNDSNLKDYWNRYWWSFKGLRRPDNEDFELRFTGQKVQFLYKYHSFWYKNLRDPSILNAWESFFEDKWGNSLDTKSWFDYAVEMNAPMISPLAKFVVVTLPKGYKSPYLNNLISLTHTKNGWQVGEIKDKHITREEIIKSIELMKITAPEEGQSLWIVRSPRTLLREWLMEWNKEKRVDFPTEEYYLFNQEKKVINDELKLNILTRWHEGKSYKLFIPFKTFNKTDTQPYYENQSFIANNSYSWGDNFLEEIYMHYLLFSNWEKSNWISSIKFDKSRRSRWEREEYYRNSYHMITALTEMFNSDKLYFSTPNAGISVLFMPKILRKYFESNRLGLESNKKH